MFKNVIIRVYLFLAVHNCIGYNIIYKTMIETIQGVRYVKTIGIGKQDFASVIEDNCFFVDKTSFIKEWWDSKDDVTLITRPRRFGKTLNMSMLNCFFSNQYKDRSDLFDSLSIWEDEDYRKIQGTYPVIFMSFASVKADNLGDAKSR